MNMRYSKNPIDVRTNNPDSFAYIAHILPMAGAPVDPTKPFPVKSSGVLNVETATRCGLKCDSEMVFLIGGKWLRKSAAVRAVGEHAIRLVCDIRALVSGGGAMLSPDGTYTYAAMPLECAESAAYAARAH